MNAFKSYASRALNLQEPSQPRWARHGSTRYLWSADQVSAAVGYVVSEQGGDMAVYEQHVR